MTVQYDFYKNPSPKDSKKRVRYHARVVPYGTVDTKELAQRIHSRCTVTPADVKAVLSSLSDVVIEELKDGNRIHIEGLGYLQITLECPPVQSPKEIRAESIRFKSVAFRPEAELKKRLRVSRFERVPRKNHSSGLMAGERLDALLAGYFAKHGHITRIGFQTLCGFTRTTANRRLKELREAGKIDCLGAARASIYVAGEKLDVHSQGSQGSQEIAGL